MERLLDWICIPGSRADYHKVPAVRFGHLTNRRVTNVPRKPPPVNPIT